MFELINPIEQIQSGDYLNGILNILVILIFSVIFLKIVQNIAKFIFILYQNRTEVYLKIRVPREDSTKDNEKKEEKDFKEKISIMEQCFRNVHELSELSLRNIIRTTLFDSNIVSFEIVAQNKTIDFYLSVPLIYRDLLEKQITAYYPNADLIPVERYKLVEKGNKLRMYFVYLTKDFWYPFKTYKTLENDPLNDLTNIFSKLEADESAGLQLTFRPIHSKKYNKIIEKNASILFKGKELPKFHIPGLGFLNSIIIGLFFGYDKIIKDKPESQSGFVRMLQPLEERSKRMGEKAAQPQFRTVIRYFASAKTIDRAEQITNSVNLAFSMYSDESANKFQSRRIIPIDFINNKVMGFNYQNRMIDTGPGSISAFGPFGEKNNIMSPEEMASIFHLPCSRYNHTPTINWLPYKVLPAPIETPTEGILLGYNVYRGLKKEIRMLRKDRTRHHYCIGKSGSGKSVFLSWLARQDIKAGDGVGVIDPHGDLIEELVTFVPKERAKEVVVFNPADTERPMGLNMLEAKTPEEMDMASSQATEIFIKLFGDEIFGPRIQHYFRNACLSLMEDVEEGATLIDVPRMFVDDEFMKYKVSKIKNPVVRSFWDHEYAHTGDREKQEMIPYFSSKFGPFITNSIMRNTIGQTKSAFNFRTAMDKQQILLINLSKGKIGDLNTQLLGLIMVARIQMAAMSRVDIPEEDRKDFYLYVDEFQNFSTDSFCSILSEARKYHLALIMANQYIKQLEKKQDTSIRDAVFGNVGTMMSFKVGADDGEYLSKEYAPVLTEQDIISIANYKAYIKLNINNTTSRPFSLETIYDMKESNKKVGDIITQYSRIKYGRKREFVDQEIRARIGIDI
jgi:hypothetical protein